MFLLLVASTIRGLLGGGLCRSRRMRADIGWNGDHLHMPLRGEHLDAVFHSTADMARLRRQHLAADPLLYLDNGLIETQAALRWGRLGSGRTGHQPPSHDHRC